MYLCIVFLLLSFIGRSVSQECTQAAVDSCTQPLAIYGLKGLAVFPPLDYTEVNQLCADIPGVTSCIVRLRPNCDVFLARFIDGLSDAYTYICGDDFIIFYENTECFARPDILEMSNKCNSSYQNRVLKNIDTTHYRSNNAIAKETCSNIRSYVFCLYDGLRDICGKDAADWQHEVNVRALTPMLAELGTGCDLDRALFTTAEIAGIVVGSFLGLCLIIFIIYLCTCNVRTYRRKYRSHAVRDIDPDHHSNNYTSESYKRKEDSDAHKPPANDTNYEQVVDDEE